MKDMIWLVRRHPLISTVFLLGLAVTLFFAVQLMRSTLYWSDPARQDQPPEAWMSPRYVAMSWDVPPEVVADALGVARDGQGRRITLGEIAKVQGTSVEALSADLVQAIEAHRGAHD